MKHRFFRSTIAAGAGLALSAGQALAQTCLTPSVSTDNGVTITYGFDDKLVSFGSNGGAIAVGIAANNGLGAETVGNSKVPLNSDAFSSLRHLIVSAQFNRSTGQIELSEETKVEALALTSTGQLPVIGVLREVTSEDGTPEKQLEFGSNGVPGCLTIGDTSVDLYSTVAAAFGGTNTQVNRKDFRSIDAQSFLDAIVEANAEGVTTQAAIAALTADLASANLSTGTLQAEIARLTADNQSQSSTIAAIQAELTTVGNARNVAEALAATQAITIAEQQSALASRGQEVTSLRAALLDAEALAARQAATITEKENALVAAQLSIAAEIVVRNNAQELVAQQHVTIEALEAEKSALLREVTTRDEVIAHCTGEAATTTAAARSAERRLVRAIFINRESTEPRAMETTRQLRRVRALLRRL